MLLTIYQNYYKWFRNGSGNQSTYVVSNILLFILFSQATLWIYEYMRGNELILESCLI